MFRRVLVANRGEIARRIIRTLNRLKIESVALYSDADRNASYLSEATRIINIGAAPAKDSYLCQEAVLEAALMSECEAIHPGFGFLSENAVFAERCRQQKLSFIGPKPHAISIMGDKAVARETMALLGVKTLFGSQGTVANVDEALLVARKAGYPVLLKARSGGGGKGMRKVFSDDELAQAYGEAQHEARSAFGDQEVYVEKFIEGARHIEFQVLGDHYGKIVCIGERECSVQRKNQKLIEEAPATGISDELRREISLTITHALSKIGYENAGTMEFLLDRHGELYFMEMNTRIQVEHPVTELVYGIDIVEWQLRIACGERLSFDEESLFRRGHAIECRINAENPAANFLPSPGVVREFIVPSSREQGPVRIETHIEPGSVVSPYYDSMLAKIIVHADTRSEAIILMRNVLQQVHIAGVSTTLPFHQAILSHEDFVCGRYNCAFVDDNFAHLLEVMHG